jgi:hypothetical protein
VAVLVRVVVLVVGVRVGGMCHVCGSLAAEY